MNYSLQRLPLRKIYPFPRKFEHQSKSADNPANDGEPERKMCRWYIGILRHPLRGATRKRLDLSWEVALWTRSLLVFKNYDPSMGVDVSMCKWSELPDDPEIFPEGMCEFSFANCSMWIDLSKAKWRPSLFAECGRHE